MGDMGGVGGMGGVDGVDGPQVSHHWSGLGTLSQGFGAFACSLMYAYPPLSSPSPSRPQALPRLRAGQFVLATSAPAAPASGEVWAYTVQSA
jgi:hypothetical protein